MGRRLRGLSLALVGSVVLFMACELGARSIYFHVSRRQPASLLERVEADPGLAVDYGPAGRRYRPGADVVLHNELLSGEDVAIRINAHGFRDREIPRRCREGELRILALGDSITAGDYLPADQVYVEVMERSLGPVWPHGPVEVINAAIGNIGLQDEMKILRERGLGLHPNLVLLQLYLNDGLETLDFAGSVARRSWWRRYSVLADTLYTRVRMRAWVQDRSNTLLGWITAQDELAWRSDREAFLELTRRARLDWGAAWEESSWRVIERELAALRELAEHHGFEVAVVMFPVSFQVQADFLERTPQAQLEQRATAMRFAFLDLLPLLRDHRDEELFFDQAHLVASANSLVARRIVEFLRSEVLPSVRPCS